MTDLAAMSPPSSHSAIGRSSLGTQLGMFKKLTIALVALFTASAAAAAPSHSDPSFGVCATGVLSNDLTVALNALGIAILDCAAGETCMPLVLPIVGDVPIGVSFKTVPSRRIISHSPADLSIDRAANMNFNYMQGTRHLKRAPYFYSSPGR